MPAPAEKELGAKTSAPLNPVYYDFDRSNLTKKAQETLKKNSEWIKANPGKKVSLEGHTDERGTNEYNMALGARRAKSAEKYLKTLGIPKEQLSTTTFGEELPADPGHNESAWSKNRRTESVVKE
jgi:peptidoglycan-associated lipoprotein